MTEEQALDKIDDIYDLVEDEKRELTLAEQDEVSRLIDSVFNNTEK